MDILEMKEVLGSAIQKVGPYPTGDGLAGRLDGTRIRGYTVSNAVEKSFQLELC